MEGKGDVKMKRVRSGEASYAVCRCEGFDREMVYNHMDSDDREEWSIVRSRRDRRKEKPSLGKAESEVVPRDERRGKVRRTERMRNRPEAILVKVDEGKEWLQVY